MSRRGHLYGMFSTYHHSWFLKTDGKGNVRVSNAVGADARGGARHVSVTEVCRLAFLHYPSLKLYIYIFKKGMTCIAMQTTCNF